MVVIVRTMVVVRLVRLVTILWIKQSYHGNNHNRFVTLYHTTLGILGQHLVLQYNHLLMNYESNFRNHKNYSMTYC